MTNTDREARLEEMLERGKYDDAVSLGWKMAGFDTPDERMQALLAHDAAQRSRIEELKRAIKSTNKLLAFVARHPDSSPGLDVDTVREQWEYNQRVLQGGSDGSDG